MGDYIEKGHAEVPVEEVNLKIKPVWYLPHHPVVHPTSFKTREGKSRVQLRCQVQACIFKRTVITRSRRSQSACRCVESVQARASRFGSGRTNT